MQLNLTRPLLFFDIESEKICGILMPIMVS